MVVGRIHFFVAEGLRPPFLANSQETTLSFSRPPAFLATWPPRAIKSKYLLLIPGHLQGVSLPSM